VALPYFKRATDLQPYNLEFQEKYGSVQAQLGQLKAAEKTFRFILREQPQRKVALANLGLVLAQKGQITAALQHYDRALQLDPDYRSALLNKIGLLVQLNRKEEAQGAVQQLLNKHPETKALLQQQGILQ
jgi:tetratricopeptide (TPR) repeat protein